MFITICVSNFVSFYILDHIHSLDWQIIKIWSSHFFCSVEYYLMFFFLSFPYLNRIVAGETSLWFLISQNKKWSSIFVKSKTAHRVCSHVWALKLNDVKDIHRLTINTFVKSKPGACGSGSVGEWYFIYKSSGRH